MHFNKIILVVFLSVLLFPVVAAENEQTWTVNFKGSDIQEVIKFISEATGKTIIISSKVRGNVNVISNEPVNEEELYALFLSVLDVSGFTAIENDGVVRVVGNRDARSLAIPTDDGSKEVDDLYMTQVVQLKNISAAKLLPIVRPLVPQHGHISAYDPSNALIITDTRANIARLQKIISQIDTSAVLTTDLVELQYAQAEEVVKIIKEIEKVDAKSGSASKSAKVVADKRINGVLVHGDDMQRQRVKRLLKRLDRPQINNSNVRVIYLKYAKAEQVAKVLNGVLKNIESMERDKKSGGSGSQLKSSIQADEDTNAILITADSDTLQSLMVLVESLDIRRAQVLVEAIIVEIDENAEKEIGIDWMYRDNDHGFGSSNSTGLVGSLAAGAIDNTDDSLTALVTGLSGISGQVFGLGRLGSTDFIGMLKLLQDDSNSNILSTPSLLTTDNHTASISVGQNVPFVTGSYSGTGSGSSNPGNPFQTIERKDVGILLEVTPHVNDGDTIVMDITQEISSVLESGTAGLITNQRKIDTQVMAASGEVIVLGGLIKDDIKTGESRVPVLGDIPILGNLFRSQSSSKIKTNLMVFIRATVVPDDAMLSGATAKKYRHIREIMIEQRDNAGILVRDSEMPMLPEWEAQLNKLQEKYDGSAGESETHEITEE